MTALLGLFLTAFLAATVLPLSSEVVLTGLAATEEHDPLGLLLVASAGNVLGSVVNWLLGRFLIRWRDRPWFPVGPEALARATRWFNRYGLWSLLLSWVPLVGDPLTLVAGLFRVSFWRFLALVAIAKTGRYMVVLGMVEWLLA